MKLVPTRPPGPNARKARAYAAEIAQLRAQGYTFEAIREALAGAGVQVSNSTVQREVARTTLSKAPVVPAVAVMPRDRPADSTPAPLALERPATEHGTSAPADALSGRDVAEAFVRGRVNNPLVRARQQR